MKSFTLAEMLLIMVLLSIAAAISLPNLEKSSKHLKLANAANNLAYAMRYAQSRAITQNKNIRLEFDHSFKKYQLLENSSNLTNQEYKPLSGQWGKLSTVDEGVVIKIENLSIDFLPTGEVEKVDIFLCLSKECMVITTQQERGQIEVLDAN